MDTNRKEVRYEKTIHFSRILLGMLCNRVIPRWCYDASDKKGQGADVNRYIDRLEARGYTFGYTDKDVEEARKRYEQVLENRIERKKI